VPRCFTLPLALLAAASIAACGQPATEAECIEIIERIARLELTEAGALTAAEVEREVQGAKEEFAGRARRDCVGKRIPKGALECVRRAKTAKEIVESCLD
jgi:hypothetical protein